MPWSSAIPKVILGIMGDSLYVAAAGLLWKVDYASGNKSISSQDLDRVVKKLLSVSDKEIIVYTFDSLTGKDGVWC